MHYLLRQANNFYMSSWLNKVYLAVIALFVILISVSLVWHVYDGVKIFNMIYKPDMQKSLFVSTDASIGKKSADTSAIFGSYKKVPERVNTNLKLLGVIESNHYKNSRAIIASQNGEGELYTVGDEISPGLSLYRVLENRVILSRNGRFETLYMDWGDVENNTSTTKTVSQPTKPILPYSRSNMPGLGGDFSNKLKELREKYQNGYLNNIKDVDLKEIRERFKNMRSIVPGGK